MIRFLVIAVAILLCALCAPASLVAPIVVPATAAPEGRNESRNLPMRFELRREGPAAACAQKCRVWISAFGAITAETPREFLAFMQGRDLRGTSIAFDSDGGSVLGAIALGREIRRLDLATTVGKTSIIAEDGETRATLSPRADCESMCAFVLLGGVKRFVPAEARVMVHQIWLGDRRDDPTAATYSAEDLVLVQRDIGRLAQYTAEMGGAIELLDLALRIPPWEPMRALSRDELRRIRLDTADAPVEREPATQSAPVAASSPAATNGTRVTRVSQSGWAMTDNSGAAVLARRHPLTVEGDNIGNFDLTVACGASADTYRVSYTERRRGGDAQRAPDPLKKVTLHVGGKFTQLAIVSSERVAGPFELNTVATGAVPAALIKTLADMGNRSLTVATSSGSAVTSIRLGNSGISQNFPLLAANCAKPVVAERPDVSDSHDQPRTLAHAE